MRWTVYCRVVDNFGDIGFSWRLAADLAARGETVRLVADDLSALSWLAPEGVDGVAVASWPDAAGALPDVAVETFGCGVPDEARAAPRADGGQPLHIDVQHLSAEAYVERSHGLPGPPAHARTHGPWYFYPGFTPRTGGLLREAAGQASHEPDMDLPPRLAGELRAFVFCYDTPAFARWLDRRAGEPTLLLCAPGAAAELARTWRGQRSGPDRLRLVDLPFVPQARFDALLRACDLNIVRGEDSLVRAIWAARPFVWHLYPQNDGAHVAKLEAFLDRFLEGAAAELDRPLRAFMRGWNEVDATAPLALPPWSAWQSHCERFAARMAAQRDLTTQLIAFAGARLAGASPTVAES